MFLGELFFALAMALLFTLIFVVGLKRPSPWSAWWAFFLVVFLTAWASSLWISPIGPVFGGIYWVPMLMVAFIVALLLSAATPPSPRDRPVETISKVKEKERVTENVFNLFFWLLLVSLIAAVVLGYLSTQQETIVTSV